MTMDTQSHINFMAQSMLQLSQAVFCQMSREYGLCIDREAFLQAFSVHQDGSVLRPSTWPLGPDGPVHRDPTQTTDWDHVHTALVGPRIREGIEGFKVVTPLIRYDGSTILVDRGFIASHCLNSMTWQHQQEDVIVIGFLKTGQNRNNFTPENRPEQGIWHWMDVKGLAETAGGEIAGVQPIFIEIFFRKS